METRQQTNPKSHTTTIADRTRPAELRRLWALLVVIRDQLESARRESVREYRNPAAHAMGIDAMRLSSVMHFAETARTLTAIAMSEVGDLESMSADRASDEVAA